MQKNLWKKIHFFCANNHDPVEMTVHAGAENMSNFYSCPKYYEENRTENEHMCSMRLNFFDAEAVVEAFSKIIDEDMKNFNIKDYTGMKFKVKKVIDVKVKSYSEDRIDLIIYNRKIYK